MTKRTGPRYAILPADAVTDPSLSGPDLKVLALLGRHIDRKGWCSRAQKRMAVELTIARGTLQRSLSRLVEAGYVEVEHAARKDGGQAANRYRVILDDDTREEQLTFFATMGAEEEEGEAPRAKRKAPPASPVRRPPPHPDRAPPASPGRGTQEERPLHRTSPSESEAMLPGRVAANDRPTIEPMPDAVPVAKAPGAVPTSRSDLDEMERRLVEAAGPALDPVALALRILTEPLGWLAAGCDLDFDVLPTIAGLSARPRGLPIRSWSYFAEAVRQARDRRLAAAAPAPVPSNVVPFDPNGVSHADDRAYRPKRNRLDELDAAFDDLCR